MKNLKKLLPYIFREKKLLLLGLIFVIIATLFQVVIPLIIRSAIDLLEHKPSIGSIIQKAAMIVGLTFLWGVFFFLGRFRIMKAARNAEYAIRNDIFSHLLKLPAKFYDNAKSGDITSRAINDIEEIRMGIGFGIHLFGSDVAIFLLSLTFMFTVDSQVALISLIPLALTSVVIVLFMPPLYKKSESLQEKIASISTHAQETFSGIRVIKSFCQEKTSVQKLKTLLESYKKNYISLIVTDDIMIGIAFFLLECCIAITIYFGGIGVIQGRLTKGDFAALTAYQFMITWPMLGIGWMIALVQRALACVGRIYEILDIRPEIRDSDVVEALPQTPHRIEFKGLSFRYDGNQDYALKDINLVIEPGKVYAFIGRTGSGKSTLLSLLLRLYKIEDGKIFVDGSDINKIGLKNLRKEIGFVPQDAFLFSDKISENIGFGMESADSGKIKSAAEIAEISQEIGQFSRKFDEFIGERGITLSGGQKQRVAIARAIIKDAGILLLDDPFSNVDFLTENKIMNNLKKVYRGKTIIIITHRIGAIKDADMVIVLDEGKVIEKGNHEELIAKGGYYAKEYQRQRLKEEIERM
jgi:ATP-binding cassette subfamily B protein